MAETVSLANVIQVVCHSIGSDLQALAFSLANQNDKLRKIALKGFLSNARDRLIKVLALIKWAILDGAVVQDSVALIEDYHAHEIVVFEAIGRLRMASTVLRLARAPVYDIGNAVDILGTGSYLKFPRIIEQVVVDLAFNKYLPEMDPDEALRKLDLAILDKLLHTTIPPAFSFIAVLEGTLKCAVENEFEVVLSLNSFLPEAPWIVAKLTVFVAGENVSCGGDNPALESGTPTGVSAWMGEPTTPVTFVKETPSSLVSGITKTNDTELSSLKQNQNASNAFIPKRWDISYLLRLLQARLVKSKSPLIDVYDILHTFCSQWSMKTLEAQAIELTENHWKAGALRVSAVQSLEGTNMLELRHWDDDCLLRINFNSDRCSGGLFVELEPSIDCPDSPFGLAYNLKTKPVNSCRRRFTMGETSEESDAQEHSLNDSQNGDNFEAAGERSCKQYIPGLNPSRLNVEKTILCGILALSEARLHKLGIELDRLLLISEQMAQFGEIPPGNSSFAAWAGFFKYTLSLSTSDNQAALHIDLPVQRYLNISVEVRTGKFLVTLVRRSVLPKKPSRSSAITNMQDYRPPRAWGSVTDKSIVEDFESRLNAVFVADKSLTQTAHVLRDLVFTVSVYSVLESVKVAVEARNFSLKHFCPFIVDVNSTQNGTDCHVNVTRSNQRGTSLLGPFLFIHLGAWDENDYFLGVSTQGGSKNLFQGVETCPTGANHSEKNTDDAALDRPGILEWFVVGGKQHHNLSVPRHSLMMSQPLRVIPGNLTSDAAVERMVDAALQKGRSVCLSMRVNHFKRHFASESIVGKNDYSIRVQVLKHMCRLVALVFDNPTLTFKFEEKTEGFSMSMRRCEPTPDGQKSFYLVSDRLSNMCQVLPITGADSQSGYCHSFGLADTVAYLVPNCNEKPSFENCGGLTFRYTKSIESLRGSGLDADQQNSPKHWSGLRSDLSAKGEDIAPFTDLVFVFRDLISAAKMEILCQCLLGMSTKMPNGSLCIWLVDGVACCEVVCANHVYVTLRCSHAGVWSKVLIGISDDLVFQIHVLAVGLENPKSKKQFLVNTIPWLEETQRLLNRFITNDLNDIDWAIMNDFSKQIVAALTMGLPLLSVFNEVICAQPDMVLNDNRFLAAQSDVSEGCNVVGQNIEKSAREDSDMINQSRPPSGKLALSMSIRARKEASGRGSRAVSIGALSHLRLRVFVGELFEFDLSILPNGVKIVNSNSCKHLDGFVLDSIIAYDLFPGEFRRMVSSLLEEAEK